MRWFKPAVAAFGALATLSFSAFAQAPDYPNVGRAPTDEEVRAWNIAIGPEGKELPAGSGTAKDGAKIFAAKCAVCHGPTAEGTQQGPRLVGGQGTLNTLQPVRTIGSYWPFATTVWDYINRAMPRNNEGSLHPDEVYSLTAFVLFRNGIVQETDVLDAKSLPKVRMPNRDGFLPPRIADIPDLQKRGCAAGHCP
jgi:S-disulfanyl-L-cysteine oxidoreductase SoxD